MYCTSCGKQLEKNWNEYDLAIICPHCYASIANPNYETGKIPIVKPYAFPKIWQAFLLVIGLFIAMVVLMLPVFILAIMAGIDLENNLTIESITQVLVFAIVIFIGVKLSKAPAREVLPLKRFNYLIIIPIFITVSGATILLSDMDNLLRTILPAPEFILNIFEKLYENPVKAVILAIIIAPFTEEFLCRGVILTGFLKNYSVNKAIIVSALLFGFMHLNPWQFTGAFFFGLIFAWFYIKTKSLWPCLIGHAIANFMPLLLINIMGLRIPGFSEGNMTPVEFQPWWFDMIGLILFCIGFVTLHYLFKRDDENKQVESSISVSI